MLFGDPWEFDTNANIVYAGCFIEQIPGSLNSDDHLQKFSFRIYFLDRVGVSEDTEGNETEVLSDMSQVAADFYSMLKYYEDDWDVESLSQVESVTEALGDMVAGVKMEVSLGVPFLVDRCQVPADDVEFETDFDMARTRLLTYTATEGDNSFTVPDLANKIVMAAYRAGSYKRIITTVPTDTDNIKVSGTDLGSRKGINATGTVTLAVGDFLVEGEILDFLIIE